MLYCDILYFITAGFLDNTGIEFCSQIKFGNLLTTSTEMINGITPRILWVLVMRPPKARKDVGPGVKW